MADFKGRVVSRPGSKAALTWDDLIPYAGKGGFYDKSQPRQEHGRFGPKPGSPMAKWLDDVDWLVNEQREIEPGVADDPATVDQFMGIGKITRKVIDDNPKVKELEAKYKRDYGRPLPSAPPAASEATAKRRTMERAMLLRREIMQARAAAFRTILERTRPTGQTTGKAVKISAPSGPKRVDMPEQVDPNLQRQVGRESRFFPSAWIDRVNAWALQKKGDRAHRASILQGLPGGASATGRITVRKTGSVVPNSMCFRPNDASLNIRTDAELGRPGAPGRMHEMMHACQASSTDHETGIVTSDRTFYRKYPYPGTSSTDPIETIERLLGDGFVVYYDEYSKKDYAPQHEATELSTTGVEYLLGDPRDYAGGASGRAAEGMLPWDNQFAPHLNYVMGLLLKGGPRETAADYREAGLPVPSWVEEGS
jgi:hypothetical protein